MTTTTVAVAVFLSLLATGQLLFLLFIFLVRTFAFYLWDSFHFHLCSQVFLGFFPLVWTCCIFICLCFAGSFRVTRVIRGFHKYTKLAIFALLQLWILAVFSFIWLLWHKKFTFTCSLRGVVYFPWHSCVVERLWKTLFLNCPLDFYDV